MPQFPYRAFLWVFAVSNAIVWFALLCGLALFLHSHLADEGHLARQVAARVLYLGWLLPTVLSLQGAIVNFRAQFLGGRFLPPANASPVATRVRNPWQIAIRTAVVFWSIGVPLSWAGLPLVLPESLGAYATAFAMGGIGAAIILALVVYVADREFRGYWYAIDEPPAVQLSALKYVARHIALPWGVVNLLINAVLAWVTYAERQGAAVTDLRLDVVVMAFLISVFMALSAWPEVETDVRRNLVELPGWLPSMPRLWVRYGYAVAVALVTYLVVTAGTAVVGVSMVPLPATIIIKGLGSGIIAAGAAGVCALWGLGRCANRRTATVHLEVIGPITALKANTEVS